MAVEINKYKNQKYNLNYAVRDAEGFVQTVTTKAKGTAQYPNSFTRGQDFPLTTK
jgi:hypothetical protein